MSTDWQTELKTAARSARGLLGDFSADIELVEKKFRTLVPQYYLNLIDPNDPNDPIAKMALPSALEIVGGGLRDPIGDLDRKAASRLTHRYPDRALLHVTNLCPMYCRFCFRKNLMNENEEEMYAGDFSEALSYLAKHSEIEEVICTGGDPFMLSDEKISALINSLSDSAKGMKRLRFHSRMPVTLPSRITKNLAKILQVKSGVKVFVVTHFNHPRELTIEAEGAIQKFQEAGVIVLNQSVLLKGVNDSSAALRNLFKGLGNMGVIPYYLHHCDLVAGGEHFRLSIKDGQKIWAELRGTLPGYLIPEYILDIPGGSGKIPVGGDFLGKYEAGTFSIPTANSTIKYSDILESNLLAN